LFWSRGSLVVPVADVAHAADVVGLVELIVQLDQFDVLTQARLKVPR
jgi:hypothetical protein